MRLYRAFLTSGHSKRFTILPHIHPFIHSFTHRSSQGEASRSGTPPPSARRSRGSNQHPYCYNPLYLLSLRPCPSRSVSVPPRSSSPGSLRALSSATSCFSLSCRRCCVRARWRWTSTPAGADGTWWKGAYGFTLLVRTFSLCTSVMSEGVSERTMRERLWSAAPVVPHWTVFH